MIFLSFLLHVDGAAMRAGVQTGDRIIKVMTNQGLHCDEVQIY